MSTITISHHRMLLPASRRRSAAFDPPPFSAWPDSCSGVPLVDRKGTVIYQMLQLSSPFCNNKRKLIFSYVCSSAEQQTAFVKIFCLTFS
jgi:hypothetical protein